MNADVRAKDKKDYARRDSNPGRVDGNDTSYPWTTRVFPLVDQQNPLI